MLTQKKKHVLIYRLAKNKTFCTLTGTFSPMLRETHNRVNCLQAGVIIWYCVFIWMEHACCLCVNESLLYVFCLPPLCFWVIVQFLYYFLWEVFFSTFIIWTNKCCMQPERMNLTQTLMFYFIYVRNVGIMTYFVPYIDMTPPIYVAGMLCVWAKRLLWCVPRVTKQNFVILLTSFFC